VCRTARPRRMRGTRAGFTDALRQHGGADEIFLGFHLGPVVERHAGRQTRRRVHLHRQPARRPGNHADLDDAAAAASRHADCRPALFGAGTADHRNRRHPLWSQPPCRRRQRPARFRGREKTLPAARPAACRDHIAVVQMTARQSARGWHITAAVCLYALLLLCLAWELWIAPLRPGGSWLALKVLPLLWIAPGITRGRMYSYRAS